MYLFISYIDNDYLYFLINTNWLFRQEKKNGTPLLNDVSHAASEKMQFNTNKRSG